MKKRSIISLILIAVMVLSTTIAFAQDWGQSSGTISSSYGWSILQGGFAGQMISMEGVYGTSTTYNNAAHTVNSSPTGNYDLSISFKLQGDLNKTAFVGITTGTTASDQSNWYVIGAPRNGRFMVSANGGSPRTNSAGGQAYLTNNTATLGSHVARIYSTDGGATARFTIDGGAAQVLNMNGAPRFVIIHTGNNGTSGSFNTVPTIMSVSFSSPVPSTTISPTPTVTPTPNATKMSLDLDAIRDFYAHQPVVHMSNQSVIYNPDGTIKQVITGNKTATATPVPTTVAPTTTVVPSTPAIVTATPIPSVVSPTKTQSPGFELVLAAMGMIAALALITRKKK